MTRNIAQAKPTVLLVDDDQFMLELQSRMLGGMGYHDVFAASSARAALALFAEGANHPDIVVCDLNMPGMDGIEFLQTLSAGPSAASVILLSGEGARIMHTVQKLLGGSRLVVLGSLEKPCRPASLGALLELWAPAGATVAPLRTPFLLAPGDVTSAIGDGRLLLHYQPKVDVGTGALCGVEALVRMNHPDRGLVYPDSFISVAEQCGAINDLTDWVLREAASQLARWVAQGLSMQVGVNVSMDNLTAPGFANRALSIARSAGVSPSDVTLEITESQAMAASAVPLECLVRLRLSRFKLSIDDFGTGHASLAQLRDVPFTELKVDRGFVHGARSNQIIRPMLEGSIGIAKRLGMTSVAEGVETAEDFALLREIGCDVAQGYFIGRPMPVASLAAWRTEWQARHLGLDAS